MSGSNRSAKAHSATRRGAATIGDVAKAAGVSKMTVSRVLNTPLLVGEETRARVLKHVALLNYVPNASARALSGSARLRIGLLYNRPISSYIVDYLLGAIEQAALLDVQLVSRVVDLDSNAAEVMEQIATSGIDAVILTPPLCDSPSVIAVARRVDLPVLLVGTDRLAGSFFTLSIDEAGAAGQMTAHLLRLGHRRIGFIVGEPVLHASRARLDGFKAAMADAGVDVPPELVAQGSFTYKSGLVAAEHLLTIADPPSAIFASNDDMAVATIMAAHRLGLDVPRDLTVVGFDDSWIATNISPELTTIRQPVRQMAIDSVTLLVQAIGSFRCGRSDVAARVANHELIVRCSDAPPLIERSQPRARE